MIRQNGSNGNGTGRRAISPPVPMVGPSGGAIRPEIIRAMEKQRNAIQRALDALNCLSDDVKETFGFHSDHGATAHRPR